MTVWILLLASLWQTYRDNNYGPSQDQPDITQPKSSVKLPVDKSLLKHMTCQYIPTWGKWLCCVWLQAKEDCFITSEPYQPLKSNTLILYYLISWSQAVAYAPKGKS